MSKRKGSQMRSIWEHIEHYSARDLTYDSDALNGLKATLNSFSESTKEPVKSLWGIPFAKTIAPLDHDQPSNRAGSSTTTGLLSQASFASDSAVFGYGLTWKLSGNSPPERQSLRRRTDFPTWSWASCTGQVIFPRLPWLTPDRPTMPDPELDVAVVTRDGRYIPISVYLTDSDNPELSRYMHIKAWSIRDALTFDLAEGTVSLDLGDADHELSGSLQLDSIPDNNHENIFEILSESHNSQKRWEAIISWLSPSTNDEFIIPFVLILITVEDLQHPDGKVYERIGSIPTLELIRLPKNRRRAASSQIQTRQSPRPTMKWAAKIIEEQEEEKRKLEEWTKNIRTNMERQEQQRETRAKSDLIASDSNSGCVSENTHTEENSFVKMMLVGIEEAKQRSMAEETHYASAMDQQHPVIAERGPTSTSSAPVVTSAEASTRDPAGSAEPEPVALEARDTDEDKLDETYHRDESDSSSDDTDPFDMGDHTINAAIRRGVAKRCYPRMPMVKREFIIR